MYLCSPKWKADWISQEDLEALLSRLAAWIQPSPYGRQAVGLSDGLHFTGGEPFLNFELLLQATAMAEGLGIPSTFVETNCFWCRDDGTTREKLQCLKRAGLKGIMISVNPFYAEHIPFERTERCIRVSLEVFGQSVMVYQLEFYRQFKRLGIQDRIAYEDYLALVAREDRPARVEMFLMGRAVSQLRPYYPAHPARAFFAQPCQPPFLRNWHNHFDNYGNFMPGFCGGISLGHWRDLDRLIEDGLDLESHPVLRYLVAEDMQALFNFARDYGYRESPEGYLSKCHLCLDIRRHLVSQAEFAELSPRQFYAHMG
jgi:hypothetical protein